MRGSFWGVFLRIPRFIVKKFSLPVNFYFDVNKLSPVMRGIVYAPQNDDLDIQPVATFPFREVVHEVGPFELLELEIGTAELLPQESGQIG